jgi:hypothetical protein
MPVAEADGEGRTQVKAFKEALQKLGRIEGSNLRPKSLGIAVPQTLQVAADEVID